MSGDFDYNEVMSILDKYFSEWNANQPIKPVEFPQHPQLTPLKNNIETSVVGLEAENILMGWRAKEAGSFQADTLEVVAESCLIQGRTNGFEPRTKDEVPRWRCLFRWICRP